MTRSTAFAASALLLLESAAAAAAAADQSPNSVMSGALAASAHKFPFTGRAQRPSYGSGGWQCPPGFVWRKAGRTDWLCVDPPEAQRIALENQRAEASWTEGSDGVPACRSGLVPREAFRGDRVCVDPLRRDTIRTMNAALYTKL